MCAKCNCKDRLQHGRLNDVSRFSWLKFFSYTCLLYFVFATFFCFVFPLFCFTYFFCLYPHTFHWNIFLPLCFLSHMLFFMFNHHSHLLWLDLSVPQFIHLSLLLKCSLSCCLLSSLYACPLFISPSLWQHISPPSSFLLFYTVLTPPFEICYCASLNLTCLLCLTPISLFLLLWWP